MSGKINADRISKAVFVIIILVLLAGLVKTLLFHDDMNWYENRYAEKLFLSKALDKLPAALQWVYAMLIVVVGWVIFNITDFTQLGSVLGGMFSVSSTDWIALIAEDAGIVKSLLFLPFAVLFSFPVANKLTTDSESAAVSVLVNVLMLVLLSACVIFIISSSYNPFIYFRF